MNALEYRNRMVSSDNYKGVINIVLDSSYKFNPYCLSYLELEYALKNNYKGVLYTHCISYFTNKTIVKGYDLNIIKGNKVYSLEDVFSLTDKDIRISHNLQKMLMGGEFNFDGKVYKMSVEQQDLLHMQIEEDYYYGDGE